MQELHPEAPAGCRQAAGELVDVAGGVAFRVVAAVEASLQRRLDRADLLRRDGAPLEPAGLQQRGDEARMLETLAIPVDVEDALAAQVEIDALALRPLQQVRSRLDRQPRRLDRVAAVGSDVG